MEKPRQDKADKDPIARHLAFHRLVLEGAAWEPSGTATRRLDSPFLSFQLAHCLSHTRLRFQLWAFVKFRIPLIIQAQPALATWPLVRATSQLAWLHFCGVLRFVMLVQCAGCDPQDLEFCPA